MTIFTAKFDAYLSTLAPAAQIEMLEMYARDAGQDGRWHEQHEINERIAAIRAANPAEAESHDRNVADAHKAAADARDARVADGFATRNID